MVRTIFSLSARGDRDRTDSGSLLVLPACKLVYHLVRVHGQRAAGTGWQPLSE